MNKLSINQHQQRQVTSDKSFFEETELPISILDDFKSAASETEYEVAPNTRRVYRSSFNIFTQYCQHHGLSHLPTIGDLIYWSSERTSAAKDRHTIF